MGTRSVKLAALIILLSAARVSAETLYVAQNATGVGDGSNCANAWALVTLNTATRWAAGTGNVSPGDTVRFCGTITGQAQILGSGASGSVITITAEPGSVFSRTHWTSPAITASGNRSFLRFTGLSITATASGTGANNGTADAIWFSGGCESCEFDNLSITNMYVRTAQSRDTASPVGILINIQDASGAGNMDNVLIHDNTFTHVFQGVFLIFPSGTATNYRFYNNTCAQVASCLWIGSGDVNRTLDGVHVYGNDVSDLSRWSGCFNAGCPGDNWHHCDGLIHIYAAHSGSAIRNLRIYNNYMHGPSCVTPEAPNDPTTTAWIFVEGVGGGTVTAPHVYNNVVAAGMTSDGQIYIKGSTSALVHHNTIVSTHGQPSFGCLSSGLTLRNNIAKQAGGAPVSNEGGCTVSSNYNNFNGYSWVSTGITEGLNGTTAEPQLNATYQLTATSPGKDTGTDVSASCPGCVTDRVGVTRPQNVLWDMGAFEFTVGAPRPPTNLRITP